MQTIFVIYMCIINVVTLTMFGLDKRRATQHQYRISERQLYTMIGLGGVIGAMIGMWLFRHKRAKSSFILVFASISFVWIVVSLFVLLF